MRELQARLNNRFTTREFEKFVYNYFADRDHLLLR